MTVGEGAVVGAGAFALTRGLVCARSGPGLERLQEATFLRRELALTDAQAREVSRLQAALGAKLAECCARHCAARASLGPALASEMNASETAHPVVEEMAQAYAESEFATVKHIRRVRELLDPAQRRRYDQLLANCVCGTCTMPAGRPADR